MKSLAAILAGQIQYIEILQGATFSLMIVEILWILGMGLNNRAAY